MPFQITGDELYELFGKFGAIKRISLGNKPETRGKAFVVFEDIYDAKAALEKLNGYAIGGRYIVVLYFQPGKGQFANQDAQKKKAEVDALKQRFGVPGSGN